MMKIWMVMIMGFRVSVNGYEKNHNGEHHEVLCGLLGAAVTKWKTTNNPATKKALAQAIFGNKDEGDLDGLSKGLPPEYKNPGNRESSCGECAYSDGKHYPGNSIPHDLLCLCTMGHNGYPFMEYGTISHLCGRSQEDLKAVNRDNHGWHSDNTGNEHVKDTWENIVKPCLRKSSDATMQIALANFSASLKDRSTPNWSKSHSYNCGGAQGRDSVCVGYGHRCDREYNENSPQWWWDFEKALTTPNLPPAKLNSTAFLNGSLDHETDSAPAGQVGSSQQNMRSSISTTSTPDETRAIPLSLFSKQEDGTALTQTLSCFLTAVLLI